MGIRILITGGTFDKEYNELTGRLSFKDTHIPEMLRLGRSGLGIAIQTLFMIDSLAMDEGHRHHIAASCQEVKEDRIVIIHGTDTMTETGTYLTERVHQKTIVLTGSMVPYKLGRSDGLFNLGSALAFAQALPHGIYIAMNGTFFAAGKVRKNRQNGSFEACCGTIDNY